MTAYEVFAPFWKCVFTFGVKSQENEFEFPGLNKRRNYIVTNGKIKYTHGMHPLLPAAWHIDQNN